VHKFVYIPVSEHFSFAKIIHPPDRCGISRTWLFSTIITQVHLVLGTIKGHCAVSIGMLTAGMPTRIVAGEFYVSFSTTSRLTGLATTHHVYPHQQWTSSPAGSSETSHPDSWWNWLFLYVIKTFCEEKLILIGYAWLLGGWAYGCAPAQSCEMH
jgi:hypothetical protein